ncbi:MAG: gliding motility-associated C-terminal domain-containing protein, partial [Cytophagales bacterium]|nr:gliding motility-associated C-terminal domain-containing protein [Cytophagales bacterium]MCA6382892.1 gliding motility-associated C-terminal domain-containing protein [Cytophagales bacterium]
NGCQRTATVTVNSLPTISGTLTICGTGTTTLTGSGTPAAVTPWASSNTGVATVNSSGLVSGVSAGTTTITYTDNNGCQRTATITVDAQPTESNAGLNQPAACGTVTLAGNVPAVGTGNWTFAPGGNPNGLGSILTPSANNSGFNGTPGISYTLRWTISNGVCPPSTDDVVVTFSNPGVTPSNAGPDQEKCNNGNFTLAANAPAVTETGAWTLISGTATIATPASNISTVTSVSGSAVLRWTISDGATCTSFDNVTLTNSLPPSAASAGLDQAVCGTSATLAATAPLVGTGTWTIQAGTGGTVTAVNNPLSTFTGTAGVTYTLRWTISNGSCPVTTDDVTVKLDEAPTPSAAGPDQLNVCGTISLNANQPTVGTGQWSIFSGAGGSLGNVNDRQSNFNGAAGISYILRWSITNGICPVSIDEVTITYDPVGPTPANAGSDQSVCGATSTILTGNSPTLGIGQWSFAVGGNPDGLGVFTDVNNQASGFSGTIGQTYLLNWSVTLATCISTDQVIINFNSALPSANAGADQAICGAINTTLNATVPIIGTGTWSIVSGIGGSITTPGSAVSAFTGVAGRVYVLRWSITNGSCPASTDDVQITFNAAALNVFNSNHCQNIGNLDLSALVSVSPAGGTLTFTGTQVAGTILDPTGLLGIQSISVMYVSGGCTINNTLLINVLASTNPGCTGGGGGTGTCATVVITPVPSPATCTLSNGSINFNINPATPIVNPSGVKITITGISTTNSTIARTNFNDPAFPALPIGVYNYSIEYGDVSCLKTGQVTVDQSGTVGTPLATNIVGPVCAGSSTGSIKLDVPGETGNVLQWSLDGLAFTNFTAGSTITGVPAGLAPTFQRVISVRRNAGDPCNASITIVIQDASPAITTTLTPTDATCANNDGSILVGTVSGGAGPYTFKLNGTTITLPTSNRITAKSGGNYTLSVIDSKNCQVDFATSINFPGLVNYTSAVNNPDCSGSGQNGSIVLTITSTGTFFAGITTDPIAPPTVFQNVVSAGSTPVTFGGLSKGTYYVSLTPTGAACPTKAPFVINSGPDQVDFSLNVQNILCFENKGGVAISAIKGSPLVNYSYEIVDATGAILPASSVTPPNPINQLQALGTVNLLGLSAGEYRIRLFQNQSVASGCVAPISSAFKSFTVLGPTAALDTLYVTRTISLPDQPTGTMLVGLKESQQTPYQVRLELKKPIDPLQAFLLDYTDFPPRNTQNLKIEYNIRNLFAGLYELKIKDALGCEKTYADIEIKVDVNIFIPNVFTPNEDGSNETFFIRNLPADSKVNISNRWGAEVYSSSNYQNDWNGSNNADGVYFYRIVAGGNTFTGWVEIIRGK